jgi:UDP-N-acetylmuramyl pentapeptide synthase
MRYRLRDAYAVLRTPIGRSQVLSGLYFRAWPLMWRLANLYRRTALRNTNVVAVIGTYGKTTTARAVTQALGRRISPRIELNDRSFIPLAMLRTEPGAKHAVVEVGIDHRGQMARFAQAVLPSTCVITSVGSEHNRSLGTLADTAREKAEMVRLVPSDGLVVVNKDDDYALWMAQQGRCRTVTFGFDPASEFYVTEAELNWPVGMRFRLHYHGRSAVVQTRLLGRHMAYPILAAFAVASSVGIPAETALSRLSELRPTPGRMELMPLANGAVLLCDYFKSGLETIYSALDTLEAVPGARKIVVLGDVSEPPGSQGPIYKALGRRVAEVASLAYFVSSRNQSYASGAAEAGMSRSQIRSMPRSVLAAAAALQPELRSGDVVLIKGRDTQRLDRIAFALAGRPVRCDIEFCRAMPMRCAECGMLERGWDGLKIIF